MAYIKHIFKLLLLVQFLALTFANYGHPDAEFIDFASPSQPSRDQMIVEAAIKRGMDGEAVAELLRTRKPVVRTTTTPSGFTKTTTYKLEPDGSISSKSILQKRNRYVYNSGSIPDELKNSPTGTVTRTFTDSDGNKVTQTIAVNRDKAVPAADAGDYLNGDWLSQTLGSWPVDAVASPQYSTNRRIVSQTYIAPNGERRTVKSWSSEPETTSFTRTSTRTITKPNGEKHVIHTTSTDPDTFDVDHKSKSPPIDDINWPGFDDPAFSPSWPGLGQIGDDNADGWEVISDPEVTTKKHFKSWSPKTWEWPEFPTHPTTTTTTTTTMTPTTTTKPTHPTVKPLPSLEEFLRSQYSSSSTNRQPSTSTSKTSTSTPKQETTTTPKTSTTTTTTKYIKIEDIPATLPEQLNPNDTVFNIEQKQPIPEDMDIDSYTPKVETNIRSYSKTHIGPEKPRLKDLDPQMQNILKNAGIVPEIEGDAITKTRTEPDGRVITTTYKVNTVPSIPQQAAYIPRQFPTYQSPIALQPMVPHLSPIADFLAQFGLTKFDLTSKNGHYSRTIIDENGDVLTATFVLTRHKSGGRK